MKIHLQQEISVYTMFMPQGLFNQQHPFCWLLIFFEPLLILVAPSALGLGWEVATLPLISLVIKVKDSSTLTDSLAEVSRNLTLKWSASSLASWYGTYLWSSKSFLFPTRILEMFSWACLSTSLIHSETFEKDSLSVIS